MDRNAITTSIFLLVIIADVCNASSSFWKLRHLAGESPSKNNNTIATTTTPPKSPSSNPLSGSGNKKLDPKPDNPMILDPKPDNPMILDPKLDNPMILDPNLSNKTVSVTLPPDEKKDPKPSGNKPEKVNQFPQKEINNGNTSSLDSNPKNDRTIEGNEEKKKNVGTGKNPNITKEDNKMKKANVDDNDSKSVIAETCDGIASRCEDRSSLTACIKGFGTGSKEVVVLVHHSGEKTLNVNLVGPFVASFPKRLRIPEHGTEKINIIFSVSKPSELTLTAGNGDCKIPLVPLASKGNFFSNLPSYEKLLTPVNGACFLIVVVGIIGALWACCIFRRQDDDGIPYQELEMGLSGSMAGTEGATAEGWDQVWDDDWDEDTAVKSPSGRNTADISANVTTARPSNRDGWEDDWDD